MRNHSNDNEFDLHENEPVGGSHFNMNGFALRLVLTRRQKGTGNGLVVRHREFLALLKCLTKRRHVLGKAGMK